MVDLLVLIGLNILVNGWFVYQWFTEALPVVQAAREAGTPFDVVPTERASTLQTVITLLAVALWFAYEVPAIANTGQTLGKRLIGVRVVTLDGGSPGFLQSTQRWILQSIGVVVPLIGVPFQILDALWCTWDRPLRQCLHDKTARTVVVSAD